MFLLVPTAGASASLTESRNGADLYLPSLDYIFSQIDFSSIDPPQLGKTQIELKQLKAYLQAIGFSFEKFVSSYNNQAKVAVIAASENSSSFPMPVLRSLSYLFQETSLSDSD